MKNFVSPALATYFTGTQATEEPRDIFSYLQRTLPKLNPDLFKKPSLSSRLNLTNYNLKQSMLSVLLGTNILGNDTILGVDHVKYEANNPTEDRLVVTRMKNEQGLFLAVFDGHGGGALAEYASKNMYKNFETIYEDKKKSLQHKEAIAVALEEAFDVVENGYLSNVEKQMENGRKFRRVGSCALCVVITKQWVVVANSGDSKAVLINNTTGETIDLNRTLNTSCEQEKARLRNDFSDPDILVTNNKNGASYIKGCLIPTRCLGDFHMKHARFARGIFKEFSGPYITHVPEIKTFPLKSKQFSVVVGSDGLWDELNNEEVSKVVISERGTKSEALLEAALNHVAEKNQTSKQRIREISPNKRREFHDDISIVVADLSLLLL